jgi:hypothetical protein
MSHTQLSLYHRGRGETSSSHSRVLTAANSNCQNTLAVPMAFPYGPEPGPLGVNTGMDGSRQLHPLIARSTVLPIAIVAFVAVSWVGAQLIGMLLALYQ